MPERIKRFHWVDLFLEDGYGRLLQALQIRAKGLGIGIQNNIKKEIKAEIVASELWKETVNEIISLPNIHDSETRQAIIRMAFGNEPIIHFIKFSGSSSVFANRLLDVLAGYQYLKNGKLAIIEMLDCIRNNFVGVDHAEHITKLMEKWNTYMSLRAKDGILE